MPTTQPWVSMNSSHYIKLQSIMASEPTCMVGAVLLDEVNSQAEPC